MQHLSPRFFLFSGPRTICVPLFRFLADSSAYVSAHRGGAHRCPCLLLSEIESRAFPLPFLAAVSCLRWWVPQIYV